MPSATPGGKNDSESDESDVEVPMTDEARNEMLKEMGIQIVSREDEDKLKKELDRIKAEAKKELEAIELTLDDHDELGEKYSEEMLRKLRELGMTDQQLKKLGPEENPFKNFNFANRNSFQDIL